MNGAGGPAKAVARQHAIWPRVVIGLFLVTLVALGGAWLMHHGLDEEQEMTAERSGAQRELLAVVSSWAYQLQGVDIVAASRARADLIVVDEALDATPPGAVRAARIQQLKRKPDGSRRLVLAYLSIGEAEDYRSYWNKAWVRPGPSTAAREPMTPSTAPVFNIAGDLANTASPTETTIGATGDLDGPMRPQTPAWLGDQNPEWRGNYRVRFWDPAWQALIFGGTDAAIERIVAAGFDGVYLDRADVYAHWSKERPTARDDMVQLIERLSTRARTLSPGFLIVMQNAEELLGQHRLRRALDAVAKEDLLFGVTAAGMPNTETEIASSVKYFQKARKDGLPVLVVEYVSEKAKIDEARKRIESLGFIPNFAPRALDRLVAEE